MNSETFYEQVEAYLDGLLRGQPLADFEQALLDNEEWAQHVAFTRLTKSAIQDKQSIAVQALLAHLKATTPIKPNFLTDDSLEKQASVGQEVRGFRHWRYWLAGVVLVIVGVCAVWYVTKPPALPPPPLPLAVQAYFDFTPEQLNIGGAGTEAQNDPDVVATELYKKGEYQKAIPLWEAYFKKEPDDLLMYYPFGVSLLKEHRFAEAEAALRLVIAGQSGPLPLFRDKAQYYLALALLQQNKVEEARFWLKNIQGGDFKPKAEAILKALEQN